MVKTRASRGRPSTGLNPGELASEYPRLTIRLPQPTLDELDAAARATGVPQWRVIVEAVQAYYRKGPALTDDQLRIARAILRSERGESDT
jgi:hypothetical protein